MRKSTSGFTIIEIIVVLVVLAILIAIVGSAYNITQQQSRNAERYTEMKEWQKLFDRYQARYGEYPRVHTPTGGTVTYCLGYNFPIGANSQRRCRDYISSTATISFRQDDNAALMTELKKVGSLPPTGPRNGIAGIVGPYVEYTNDFKIQIRGIFEGSSSEDCPNGTTVSWVRPEGSVVMCGLDSF